MVFSMRNNIAITGANGFVGGFIADYLRKNNLQVFNFVRKKHGHPSSRFDIDYSLGDSPNLSDIDTLIHCAWNMKPKTERDSYLENVKGSEILIQSAVEYRVKKIIFLSSISSYENCVSNYGKEKFQVEKSILKAGGIVLRPGLVYTKRLGVLHGGGMLGSLQQITKKLPILPSFYPSPSMWLVNANDLSVGILNLVLMSKITPPNQAIIAANQIPIKFNELLHLLAKQQNNKITTLPLPWQIAYISLCISEKVGIRLGFKSDSLLGLMYPNPKPDWTSQSFLNVKFSSHEHDSSPTSLDLAS
jgi:nucleoside-diphosphate-sugar epimerase